MEYLCKLVSYPNENLILDPFMGSGTTGVAALKTGCDFIGFEKELSSFTIAESRLKKVKT